MEGLKHNLLSIIQIYDRGYHVDFGKDHCSVISKATNKVVLTGYRHYNIYEANLEVNSDGPVTCMKSKATHEYSWIWHKKLSHLNFNNINELVKKDLIRGLPIVHYSPGGLYDSCQKAKQRRPSFKSKTESSIDQLYHLLHLDLFGLVNIMSIANKRYTLVIVDESTRYIWVYFMHRKSFGALIC